MLFIEYLLYFLCAIYVFTNLHSLCLMAIYLVIELFDD